MAPLWWRSGSAILLIGLACTSVAAQDRSSTAEPARRPVPVEELVCFALANNPEIQAARLAARAELAQVPQVTTLPDPQLMTTVFLNSIQTAAGPQDVLLGLQQQFPWFGKLELRGQVASHDALAAFARAAATELQVVEAVRRHYFEVYFLDRAAATTRQLIPPLETIIEVARSRYETGGGAGLESVLQAQVELSTLKSRLIQLDQAKRVAQAKLAQVLHLPAGSRIDPVEEIAERGVPERMEMLLELARQCQPRLNARRREVARDRSMVALASRNYWPDVTMSANWIGIGDQGLSPVANGEDAFSLGVGVNLPIYRRKYDAALQEAQLRRSQSVRNYAATLDEVEADVETYLAEYREHEEVLAILRSEIVPRARQTLDLTTEAYRVERATFQQLIDVYRTLLNYQVELYRRQASREQARASLERAVGCAVTGSPPQEQASPAEPPPQPDAATPLPPPASLRPLPPLPEVPEVPEPTQP